MNARSLTLPRVRYHVLLYVIVLLALAGCGGDDEQADGTRTTPFKVGALKKPGESGVFRVRACKLIPPARVASSLGVPGTRLVSRPNYSLDLSICEWHGGRVGNVRLLVDTAPRAQLRYYNLLAEQHEYHNADPALKARQIKGVGEDSAYGGAGAWWTRARSQLVAYDHDKLVKVRVNIGGFGDGAARAGAVGLAKLAVRKLR
jgi:hypothetical protein